MQVWELNWLLDNSFFRFVAALSSIWFFNPTVGDLSFYLLNFSKSISYNSLLILCLHNCKNMSPGESLFCSPWLAKPFFLTFWPCNLGNINKEDISFSISLFIVKLRMNLVNWWKVLEILSEKFIWKSFSTFLIIEKQSGKVQAKELMS